MSVHPSLLKRIKRLRKDIVGNTVYYAPAAGSLTVSNSLTFGAILKVKEIECAAGNQFTLLKVEAVDGTEHNVLLSDVTV